MITPIPGRLNGLAELKHSSPATIYVVFGAALLGFLILACNAQAAFISAPSATQPVLSTAVASTPTQAVLPLDDPASPTSPPSPLPLPSATAAPVPVLHQLTHGGCCVDPFWSPDGSQVLYLDQPDPGSPAGFWGVALEGGEPQLYTDRLGVYSPDMQLLAYPQAGATIVERLSEGQRWEIPNGGRAISFSPDGLRVAWTQGQSGPPFDTARREVWISQVDGSQARPLVDLYGGGFSGWFPDGRLLISGRLEPQNEQRGVWVIAPEDGDLRQIAAGDRLRGFSISPGGTWLAYQETFSADPARNGLWLVYVDSGESRRLELFGAYQWRDDDHLLVIPLELDVSSHTLWQVEAATGTAQALTGPTTPFKIATGDWAVSPDGNHIAFVSAHDHNLWLITLPQ